MRNIIIFKIDSPDGILTIISQGTGIYTNLPLSVVLSPFITRRRTNRSLRLTLVLTFHTVVNKSKPTSRITKTVRYEVVPSSKLLLNTSYDMKVFSFLTRRVQEDKPLFNLTFTLRIITCESTFPIVDPVSHPLLSYS